MNARPARCCSTASPCLPVTDAGTCNGQVYLLKPALRMVDNLQMPPGRYVVAYTCDADNAEIDATPETGEVVNFTPASGTTVDVVANQTVTVDFATVPAT